MRIFLMISNPWCCYGNYMERELDYTDKIWFTTKNIKKYNTVYHCLQPWFQKFFFSFLTALRCHFIKEHEKALGTRMTPAIMWRWPKKWFYLEGIFPLSEVFLVERNMEQGQRRKRVPLYQSPILSRVSLY